MKEQSVLFANEADLAELFTKFQLAEVVPGEFKHPHHLAVALVLVSRHPAAEAMLLMREGLNRILARHGLDAYHETVTQFWILYVAAFLANAGDEQSVLELANELAQACHNSSVIKNYYSSERLDSPEAKATFMPPDLKPLDFA
jgi:hypothetical protein